MLRLVRIMHDSVAEFARFQIEFIAEALKSGDYNGHTLRPTFNDCE